MDSLDMLLKKKSAVEGQIKRVCEKKEKGDLVFLQEELEKIEESLLDYGWEPPLIDANAAIT